MSPEFPPGLRLRGLVEVAVREVLVEDALGVVAQRRQAQRVLDKNFPNSDFNEAAKPKAWWKFW